MGQFGAVACMWSSMAPAGVACNHEGFKAGYRGGNDDVVFVDLGPNACEDGIKGGIGRGEFDFEVVKAENDECDGSTENFFCKQVGCWLNVKGGGSFCSR